MDIVIKDVATGSILNINDTALLKKTDIFNDTEQTQIKIGKNAGVTQAPNSIILNATGDVLNNNAMNDNGTCVIAPIRAQPVASHFLTYDDTTKEIVKSTVAQVQSAVGGGGGANRAIRTYSLAASFTWGSSSVFARVTTTWNTASTMGTPAIIPTAGLFTNTSSTDVFCTVHFAFNVFYGANGWHAIRAVKSDAPTTAIGSTISPVSGNGANTTNTVNCSFTTLLAPSQWFAVEGISSTGGLLSVDGVSNVCNIVIIEN